MVKQKSNNVRLGLFVTVTTIILLVSVYLIGNNKNIFGSSFVVSTILNNAGGLQAGNNVRFAGINVGTVKKINITSDSTLMVDLRLANNVQSFIRKNAKTSVSIDGLVGSALINIHPGEGPAPAIEAGDILRSADVMGTSELIANLGITNENLALFVQDLLEISDKINNGEGLIPQLIQDSIMASNTMQIMHNLNIASQHIVNTLRKLENSIDELKNEEGLAKQLMTDTVIMTNLRSLSLELNEKISQKLDTIVDGISETSANLSQSTESLQQILEQVLEGNGALSQLLYDPEMARTLRKTLENIEAGTAKFDEDMEALKHNFLFRRYFRKQDKIKKKEEMSLSNQ
ncbi:MAG: MCE family protein [Saprospiraceae bacterium]|nr:MCE family protein [Saprospiraceae bacterium]